MKLCTVIVGALAFAASSVSASEELPSLDEVIASLAEDRKNAPPPTDLTWEDKITAFYQKNSPDDVKKVPGLLKKYAGRENALMAALVEKYKWGVNSGSLKFLDEPHTCVKWKKDQRPKEVRER